MIRWFLIVVLFTILQISSSSESEGHFVGERNGKNYTIEYDNYFELVLTVKEPNGIVKKFPLSTCDKWYVLVKNYSINSQGTHLLFHIRNTESDNFLVSVNLTTLSDIPINGYCIPINEIYFGKYKIYIYKVEDSNILKRWLVTPEGEEISPVVIAKTELPIRDVYVHLDSNLINLVTWEGNIKDTYLDEYYNDLPKCDVPNDGTPCDDDKVPEETTQVSSTTERTNTEPVENVISTVSFKNASDEQSQASGRTSEIFFTSGLNTTNSPETIIRTEPRNDNRIKKDEITTGKSQIVSTTEQVTTKHSGTKIGIMFAGDRKVVAIIAGALFSILILLVPYSTFDTDDYEITEIPRVSSLPDGQKHESGYKNTNIDFNP